MASTGFHSPPWHEDERTPIVDNKIISRNTGELLPGNGAGYLGPPAVDIVISNIHCDAEGYVSRNTRAFPVEKLLWQVMKVIEANDLEILSINVTTYSINVMLAHPATPSQMREWSDRMANGIWEPEVFYTI